jgi:FkbM family methyltransferase
VIRQLIQRSVSIALDPHALIALLRVPHFSLTAYQMAAALKRQGIYPRTVLDVGANIGQTACMMAYHFPEAMIYSFEPLKDCAARLKQMEKLISNLRVNNVALGDYIGDVEMHVNSHHHSSSVLSLAEDHKRAFPTALEVATTRVPVTTLDAFASGIDLLPPVLMKLDVQGYEPAVLRGALATLKKIDYVVLECSLKKLYQDEMLFPEMLELMTRLGFRFLRPIGWLADTHTDEILQMDALFVRRDASHA